MRAALRRRAPLPPRPAAGPLIPDALAPADRRRAAGSVAGREPGRGATGRRGGGQTPPARHRRHHGHAKAATHPTDSKLLHRGIEILARLARRHGMRLRQSYLRVTKRARREAAKLIHSGRRRQAERQVRRLRTWLGRLFRDIGRKIAGNAAAGAAFDGPLALIARLLRQRREDRGRDKLYSLHAPEVECIGKGKAHARFEFGVKVSLATTNAAAPGGQFVLGARALPGNPYDGHTLAAQIAQAERLTGVGIERAYVDRGYRGHDADRDRVVLPGQKRGVTRSEEHT